jgi:6-phosphogluconolactonase
VSLSPGDRIVERLEEQTGGPVPDVVVEPDAEMLARAAAAAMMARLAAAQAVHGTASVVLTGGGVGTAVLRHVAELAEEPAPGQDVDWTAVDVWWGDERFVPADDDERNEKGAREALLDRVGVPPQRVHPMPASDAGFDGPEEAAEWYAGALADAAGDGPLPRFDLLLLGMGPEGHVASIFPATPAVSDERTVVAVRDCPKPPPTRISLGFSAINAAEEVWLLVSGAAKAPAVARALTGGATPEELPAAGVHGRRATRWLLDAEAAGELVGQG